MPSSAVLPEGKTTENQLLAHLPEAIRALWLPHLELVNLQLEQVCFATVRLRERILCRNCSRRKRRNGGICIDPRRQYHAESCGCAKRRLRSSHEVAVHEARIQFGTARYASHVAVYPSIDYANDADRCMQPTSFLGPATMSMALAQFGSPTRK